jgi:adenosine kinase
MRPPTRIAVTGSIATDHLLTFAGLFHEQLLPDQLDKLSVVFLADSLEVRRGGTGANIAFGMGMLGSRPQLIGAVGRDAADYLSWLADHGVDTSGVRTSATLSSPRFTVTTDQAQNQIGSFYPGAMAEAADISLADLAADLVVVSPNDPGAMLRHTAECRERGVPFAADPSQTLTFLDGDAIRELVTGAAYLFTNEYEAGLVADKTGWTDAEVLELVGTRITTHGAAGSVISRKGEADIHVGIAEADQVVDPTGTGDAFRAGFLTALTWGLGLERAAQVGSLVATHVVETVGPQDYAFTPASFLTRFEKAYGAEARAEVAAHLS